MKRFYKTLITAFVFGIIFAGYSTSALTVSPAILEIAGDPGTTLTGTVRLFNEGDTTETFFTSFENFEPSDESGTPRFVGAENGLATWLSTTGTITLAPKERVEVPFTLNIPIDTDPGGYFAAIFFGTQPPSPEGGIVAIGGRLGVLTLLRVNGDIPEDGGLLDYTTKDSRNFYTTPPVEFEYRFSNLGGDRVIPRGDIEIKNTFGTVRDTIDANPIDGSVLPNSARRFRLIWDVDAQTPKGFIETVKYQWDNFYFGFYTAELNLGWGFTNQITGQSISFFMFPWQLLLVVILILSLLLILIKFGGKAYKKSLMRQLEQMQAQAKKEEDSIENTSENK